MTFLSSRVERVLRLGFYMVVKGEHVRVDLCFAATRHVGSGGRTAETRGPMIRSLMRLIRREDFELEHCRLELVCHHRHNGSPECLSSFLKSRCNFLIRQTGCTDRFGRHWRTAQLTTVTAHATGVVSIFRTYDTHRHLV